MHISEGGLVQIGPVLANLEVRGNHYFLTIFKYNQIEERINDLRVEKLINKNGSAVDLYKDEYLNKLEEKTISHSSKIKTRLGSYKKSDVKNSINFLEIFLFYCGQRSICMNREDQASLEKKIKKTIISLEKGLKALKHSKKQRKQTFKPEVKRVVELMNKIVADHLTLTEKLAYGKKIDIALRTLRKYT